jgi:hypothetical protein
MTRSIRSFGALSAAALILACSAEAPTELEVGRSTLAASHGENDQGTRLLVEAWAAEPLCNDDGTATVDLSVLVSTTGSVAPTTLTASVDGGEPVDVGSLHPTDYSGEGRDKSASAELSLTLEAGEHEIVICAIQPGAQGRTPKEACSDVVLVIVDCDAECGDGEVFGNLVGNPVLCHGAGTPHVPVHLRGEFGDSVALTISGPDEFVHEESLFRAGESCNYHANWDTRDGNHGGTGSYTFSFEGENGATYSFSRDLVCAD